MKRFKKMFPKNHLAQFVISAVHQFKIDTVVLSPGSRNAPLTIGFSNHPEITALSVVDERCAAFFALGIAQQTQKPVAIVCTSGSALLNYYPAIAEAFYSKIPLLIISADRPKHLIDIGDGQTIRQENVFDNHILYAANLSDLETDQNHNSETERSHNSETERSRSLLNKNNQSTVTERILPVGRQGRSTVTERSRSNNLHKITKALQTAITQKGPVHINVPFDEPLYETVSVIANEVKQSEKEITSSLIPRNDLQNVITNNVKPSVSIEKFSKIWNISTKKLILIGSHFPDNELQTVLNTFVDDASVIILTETISNVHHPKFINSIDQLIFSLDESKLKELQPEVLITLGGMVVSKKIKQFLRKHQPKHHWHINEFTKLDTYHCLTEFVQENAVGFLNKLALKGVSIESVYQQKWLLEKEDRNQNHQRILAKTPYSDLKVFEQVLAQLPINCNLQLSNSATIRYSQLFAIKPSINVFCNRGTSGIDGSTSTSIGAAFAKKNQTVFITGDLSFFYDSNALWNNYIPPNFRIIIINNAGGGIFRFIPGPQTTNATDYFETPHQLTAKHLSKMYNFAYNSVLDLESLKIALDDFFEASNQPKILEIFTPKKVNDVVLKNYFKNV